MYLSVPKSICINYCRGVENKAISSNVADEYKYAEKKKTRIN
jgi:hypothetical protein